jgi:hypothetical protein
MYCSSKDSPELWTSLTSSIGDQGSENESFTASDESHEEDGQRYVPVDETANRNDNNMEEEDEWHSI